MKYYLLSEQDIRELFVEVENAIYELKEKIEYQLENKILDEYGEED